MERKLGLSAAQATNTRVLDVGCGTGANAAAVAEWGADAVFAIDMSSAVDAAFANTRELENVHVVQADLFRLPFRHETFDLIYSVGVLMHTPDTRKAILPLAPLLRTDGRIAIWVYEDFRGIERWWSDLLRTVTTRMEPARPSRVVLSGRPRLLRVSRAKAGETDLPFPAARVQGAVQLAGQDTRHVRRVLSPTYQ